MAVKQPTCDVANLDPTSARRDTATPFRGRSTLYTTPARSGQPPPPPPSPTTHIPTNTATEEREKGRARYFKSPPSAVGGRPARGQPPGAACCVLLRCRPAGRPPSARVLSVLPTPEFAGAVARMPHFFLPFHFLSIRLPLRGGRCPLTQTTLPHPSPPTPSPRVPPPQAPPRLHRKLKCEGDAASKHSPRQTGT